MTATPRPAVAVIRATAYPATREAAATQPARHRYPTTGQLALSVRLPEPAQPHPTRATKPSGNR